MTNEEMEKVYETVKKAMKSVFSEFEEGDVLSYDFIWELTKGRLPKEYEDIDWESDLDAILDEMADNHHINETKTYCLNHDSTSEAYQLELDCMYFFKDI